MIIFLGSSTLFSLFITRPFFVAVFVVIFVVAADRGCVVAGGGAGAFFVGVFKRVLLVLNR
jgi:Na+(H+)/acetate symporter ActP